MSPAAPDWAALYQKHRESMYRVAAKILREAGLQGQAEDAVQAAMLSLMKAPPVGVDNWEAVLITAAQRRALDMLGSAAIRHAGPPIGPEHDSAGPDHQIEDLADLLDRQRYVVQLPELLSELNAQQRFVAWEYVAKERSRAEVAQEMSVTPARVSQIAKAAVQLLRDAIGLKEGSR